MTRQAKITKRELSDSFSDKAYDALINLFQLKKSFVCRGAEVEFYIQLVDEAFNDPFTSELYNKALKALKTSPNQSLILNNELSSQVKSVLKEIKSNEEQYMQLQPVPSGIVEKYKTSQALASQNNPSEIAELKEEITQLKKDKTALEKSFFDAEEQNAIKIAEAVAAVEQKNAMGMTELRKEHAVEIELLKASNTDLSGRLDKMSAIIERLLDPSASNDIKSNRSGRSSPGLFG